MTSVGAWVEATRAAITPLADAERAEQMAAYMKDIRPFLGVTSVPRRTAQRAAWKELGTLTAQETADVVRSLWSEPFREFQYAACDLLARQVRRLPGDFLADPIQALLTTTPWWDTVDGLGTAAVTPLVAEHPEQVALMWTWWDSGDRWLIRAAIQHQRGRHDKTDVPLLLTMCDRYAADREFFIAKAIGWALRDVTGWDPAAVQTFLDEHPDISAVARREAVKGLARATTAAPAGRTGSPGRTPSRAQ